jgi:hypothetical protein
LQQWPAGLPDGRYPNLGKFWRALHWKLLVSFYGHFWYILRPFGIFYGHLVYFMAIVSRLGMLNQEKSGNPGCRTPELFHPDIFNVGRQMALG